VLPLGRRSGAVWALGACTLLGCDDSSAGNPVPPPPTQIVVDPEQFDSAVACVDAPGGMRLYVATLFDVSEGDAALPQLASSPPTPCTIPVAFGYVEPGRKYRAEVDGYDVEDLVPLTAGNRLLQDDETGELVAPRWRASCGNPISGGSGDGGDLSFLQGPAEAFLNARVTVMGCTPFSDDSAAPLSTSIRVDLNQALGDLSCGSGSQQVSSFQVNPRDNSVAPSTASCGSSVTFSNLNANQTYFFDVLAFAGKTDTDAGLNDAGLNDAAPDDAAPDDAGRTDAGAPAARWRTSCYQQALSGVQQTAICEPLAPLP
jgi:hypothetical protein